MDEKIIRAIKKQQNAGIAMLLEQYGGLLQAIVRKYIAGKPQEIEECMADIVVSVWYHIDDFDAKKSSFKNWIAVIAKFKSIDALRKIQRQQATIELSEDLVHQEKVSLEWTSLLDQLPLQEQHIFKKYYFEGINTKTIAATYEANESWVHNKLSRSRKKLRTLFLKNEV